MAWYFGPTDNLPEPLVTSHLFFNLAAREIARDQKAPLLLFKLLGGPLFLKNNPFRRRVEKVG